MYVDYVSANTVRVVHSADIIKFGDLATNKNTFSLTNWPGIDIRYYHSILLKIILAVTLTWRFKKLPNHQSKSPRNVPLIWHVLLEYLLSVQSSAVHS